MSTVIELKDIVKTYKDNVVLSDINLSFQEGKIYGIVGKNGSGKTMLMKVILGFVLPTSGKVTVFGKTIGEEVDFAPDTGAIIENPQFFPYATGFSNLKNLAAIRGCITDEEIKEILEKVGLKDVAGKRVGKYSLGMRQRLGIAQAIMEHPKLLILDEPMNGLDQDGVEDVRSLLRTLQKEGTTILMSSHYQEDINELCDAVIYMNKGKVVEVSDNGIQ